MSLQLDHSDLRDYQHQSIAHLKEHTHCALWVDMGLGKTVSVLTALMELDEEFEVDSILIVAPLRVARKTWRDEINKWAHVSGLTISHMVGDADERLAAMNGPAAKIYTIGQENYVWLCRQFIEEYQVGIKKKKNVYKIIRKWKWDTLILDDVTGIKRQGAERWKWFKRTRKAFGRIVELTGTPRTTGLENLWSQVYLLDGGERLGSSEDAFKKRWFEPDWHNKYIIHPRSFAEDEIIELVSDICLSIRDDLGGPPIRENFIPCYLTEEEQAQYKRLERSYVVEIDGKKITAANSGVLAGKLLQLANGAFYTDHPNWEMFHNGKVDVLLELLDSLPAPIMICYNFKSDLARIKKALTKRKLKWDLLSDEASEDRWNEGKTPILLLHPKSAGHGLNLHLSGSENLIWFGLNWSLELYLQARARLTGGHRRIGRNVTVHHIVAEGTIDDDLIANLQSNDASQERLLNAVRDRMLRYAKPRKLRRN